MAVILKPLIFKLNCYCLGVKLFHALYHCQIIKYFLINPQALVAQKSADEVVFRHFQGEGVEFFLIGPHCSPSDF